MVPIPPSLHPCERPCTHTPIYTHTRPHTRTYIHIIKNAYSRLEPKIYHFMIRGTRGGRDLLYTRMYKLLRLYRVITTVSFDCRFRIFSRSFLTRSAARSCRGIFRHTIRVRGDSGFEQCKSAHAGDKIPCIGGNSNSRRTARLPFTHGPGPFRFVLVHYGRITAADDNGWYPNVI